MVDVTVHRSIEQAEQLAPGWESLCLVSPRTTPFQTAAWSIAWLHAMGAESPSILAIRSGRDLVGLVPLCVWGAAPGRTVSILGAGVSGRLDAIAAPGFEQPTLDALREWLERCEPGWNSCVLDEVGPGAILRDLRPPQGSSLAASAQSVCPVLALPEDGAGVDRVVPPRQAARLRRDRRRASSFGAIAFEQVEGASIGEGMQRLFSLHAKRWERRGQRGMLADDSVRAFHLEVAAAFQHRGVLRLCGLRLGPRWAAMFYGFRWRQRLSLYLGGIDPSLERASPGTPLIEAILRSAAAEGVQEIDFLRGGEPYKYQWGAVDEQNVRLELARSA